MSMRVLGTCSLCGGAVGVPENWMGEFPPVPRCYSCGATKEQPFGPVIKMDPTTIGRRMSDTSNELLEQVNVEKEPRRKKFSWNRNLFSSEVIKGIIEENRRAL